MQISNEYLKKLTEDIKTGNTKLILIKNNKLETIYTKEEKDNEVEKSMDIYSRPMFKDQKGLIRKRPVKKKEKLKIINETLYNLKRIKTFILASENTDNIEDVRVDFCEMIKEISDDNYSLKGNIYSEDIDSILEEEKCKTK